MSAYHPTEWIEIHARRFARRMRFAQVIFTLAIGLGTHLLACGAQAAKINELESKELGRLVIATEDSRRQALRGKIAAEQSRRSEREPAGSLGDKSNVIGGWLASLGLCVSRGK